MLYLTLFKLFPCFVCVIWLFLFLLRRQPNATQRAFSWLSLGGAIFFFLDTAILDDLENERLNILIEATLHFSAMVTPPFMLLALNRLSGPIRHKHRFWMWFIVPTLGSGFEIIWRQGFAVDETQLRIFHQIYFTLLALNDFFVCLLMVKQIKKLGFRWKGFIDFFIHNGSSRSPLVIGVSFVIFLVPLALKVCLNDELFCSMPVLSSILYIILGLMLVIVASAAYVSHLPKLTLAGIFNPAILIGEHDLSEAEEMLDKLPIAEAKIPVSEIPKEQREELLKKLEHSMNEGKLFLNPTLSIDSLAMHLGTNRLYISRLVNTTYHCPFRDYINRLRIEYAKDYMMQYPKATQEMIADACGFLSAQAFSHKFKQLEDCSPRQWIANQTPKSDQ